MPRTLTPVALQSAALQSHLKNSQRIMRVFPGSPAQDIGLKVGWFVLLAKRDARAGSDLELLRLAPDNTYLFYDPQAETAYELTKGPWPLGLTLTGVGTPGFNDRIKRRDDVQDQLYQAFGRGELDSFALMKDAFRLVLSLPGAKLLAPFMKEAHQDSSIARNPDFASLAFLALSHLAQGNADRADFFLVASHNQMQKSGQQSFSLLQTALQSYIAARLSWDAGDREKGLRYLEDALADAPDFELLLDTYAIWTDKPPLVHKPKWVGEPSPIDYAFKQHDPLGFWPDGGFVSLKQSLATLTAGQILIVVLLPGYRANYYYNLDLPALAALHRFDPSRIAQIHVISDSTYMLSPEHRAEAEGIAYANALPIHFLDGNQAGGWKQSLNDLSNQLGIYRAPTCLVLDKDGVVLSNGLFADESAYWDAIARL